MMDAPPRCPAKLRAIPPTTLVQMEARKESKSCKSVLTGNDSRSVGRFAQENRSRRRGEHAQVAQQRASGQLLRVDRELDGRIAAR